MEAQNIRTVNLQAPVVISRIRCLIEFDSAGLPVAQCIDKEKAHNAMLKNSISRIDETLTRHRAQHPVQHFDNARDCGRTPS